MPGTWQVSIMVSMSLMKKKNSKFTNIAKPIRAKVDTLDRVDNCLGKLLKAVGHKRTKDQRRDRMYLIPQLILRMEELHPAITTSEVAPDMKKAFVTVYEELKYLDSLGDVKRACYSEDFKSALKILVSRAGLSFLEDTLRAEAPLPSPPPLLPPPLSPPPSSRLPPLPPPSSRPPPSPPPPPPPPSLPPLSPPPLPPPPCPTRRVRHLCLRFRHFPLAGWFPLGVFHLAVLLGTS